MIESFFVHKNLYIEAWRNIKLSQIVTKQIENVKVYLSAAIESPKIDDRWRCDDEPKAIRVTPSNLALRQQRMTHEKLSLRLSIQL